MIKLTVGIEDAKQYVALAHNLKTSQVVIHPAEQVFQPQTDTNELVRKFNQACADRAKLSAIKHLCEMTGARLKISKDFVDALFSEKYF